MSSLNFLCIHNRNYVSRRYDQSSIPLSIIFEDKGLHCNTEALLRRMHAHRASAVGLIVVGGEYVHFCFLGRVAYISLDRVVNAERAHC